MRFGLCGSMNTKHPDGIGVDLAECLHAIGYDYIELSLAHMTALPETDFAALLKKMSAAGIPCEACNNFFPPSMRLTGADVDPPAVLEYVGRALTRASRLGAKVIVFGSGKSKNVPEGFSVERAWGQLITLLRNIARLAADCGITIVIEPLRKAECNIINTVAEGLRLSEAVNETSIKNLVDYYHLREEGENPDIIVQAGDAIRHVHIANPAGRMFPLNNMESDYDSLFNKLQQIKYAGRVSVEGYTDHFDEDAAASLRFLRSRFDAGRG